MSPATPSKPPAARPFSRAANVTRSDKAPPPSGNYSHVIRHGDTLHVCGWMGDDPETGELKEGIQAQTVRYVHVPISIPSSTRNVT